MFVTPEKIIPMNKPTLHVIVTVFGRAIHLRRLVDCFYLQTNTNWRLHVIHDGPAAADVIAVMSTYRDERIFFECTPKVNGYWGHPNRDIILRKLVLNHSDYVLITNDDNIYVPTFVESFLKKCKNPRVGFVYCDTLHSYLGYDVMKTELKENHIDMGSFIVKLDVARKVGFKHRHFSADGTYAVECVKYCRQHRLSVLYIPKALFIHC